MTHFPNVLCVGMHYRGASAKEVAAALVPGDTVTLERDDKNEHDAYAIKVLVGDMHIGYIERNMACWISPFLDEGQKATATVDRLVQKGNNLHPALTIEVSDAVE